MEFTEEDFKKGVKIYRYDSPPGGDEAFSQEDLDRLLSQGYSLTDNRTTDADEGDDSLTGDFSSLFGKLKESIEGIGASSSDAPDFVPTPKQIEDLLPWLSGKGNLLQEYTNQYIETGSAEFALAAVRSTEEYAEFYPGIKRGDGSLRMNESQYEQVREGYYRILLENDLNPIIFESAGKVGALIAGDVSVAEFKGRIESTRQAFREK